MIIKVVEVQLIKFKSFSYNNINELYRRKDLILIIFKKTVLQQMKF